MPILRAGDWVFEDGEAKREEIDPDTLAENRPGHKGLRDYKLPKWVWHPELPPRRLIVEKDDYYGLGFGGQRNTDGWNVAHVAAFHDDLKLLSLATPEQCKEPNKWGMTPAHMCGLAQHPYGGSVCVLHELVKAGVCDPDATTLSELTPWHYAQRQQKPNHLKQFVGVLLKGNKPKEYDARKEAQLRKRGKFAAPKNADPFAVEESGPETLPVCLLFPGQGSQNVGMMKQLSKLDSVKDMLEKAKGILGYDVLELCLEGPEDKLQETRYCQPAMYVAGLAALEQLKADDPAKAENFRAAAGLSLGEYTALTAAGFCSFEAGLKLVKARAEAMDDAVAKGPRQAMLSIAGLEEATVEKLCKECATEGNICQIANYLFPKGFSCTGHAEAVEKLEGLAQEAGALQAKMLKTSGAFHTPLMKDAQTTLRATLQELKSEFSPPTKAVYMNTTGKAIAAGTSVGEIVEILTKQVVSPVLWSQSMKRAMDDGVTDFIELGPNKQLRAMMKRINPKASERMINVQA